MLFDYKQHVFVLFMLSDMFSDLFLDERHQYATRLIGKLQEVQVRHVRISLGRQTAISFAQLQYVLVVHF